MCGGGGGSAGAVGVCEEVGEEGEGEGVFLEWVCVSGCAELGECGDGGGEGECEGGVDGDLVGISLILWSCGIGLLMIWWECRWCRFLGTLCVTALCQWKYWHYPADYDWIGTPLATFFFVATGIGDLIYPFVFYHVERIETGAPIPPHDPILYLDELLVRLRARGWSFIESHPSEVAGVVFVAVTWCIFKAVLWCLDNTSGLLEVEGLGKSGDLNNRAKEWQGAGWHVAERDKDTDRLNNGPRQKMSKARSKARDYREQIIKSMTEEATVQ